MYTLLDLVDHAKGFEIPSIRETENSNGREGLWNHSNHPLQQDDQMRQFQPKARALEFGLGYVKYKIPN
jgi:hypothetical protein